jgi:hypothetical protein
MDIHSVDFSFFEMLQQPSSAWAELLRIVVSSPPVVEDSRVGCVEGILTKTKLGAHPCSPAPFLYPSRRTYSFTQPDLFPIFDFSFHGIRHFLRPRLDCVKAAEPSQQPDRMRISLKLIFRFW